MTDTVTTPENESKQAVWEQYEQIVAQADEYGWEPTILDCGDYLTIFVRLTKPEGRTFVMKLRCEDYPEVAPHLTFVHPSVFADPFDAAEPREDAYPVGPNVVSGRGPLPVLCIKGHRDYYIDGWHGGWSNPPAHDQCLYQLVMNVRNAILNVWS